MTSSRKKKSSPKFNNLGSQIAYQAAGVDVEKGYKFIQKIKPLIAQTKRPEVLSGLGSFAALSKLPKHINNPVLVTCTDGVGTKIEIAKKLKKFHTIGIDLVAMCVNDLVTCGAEPLLFLDYLVTDKLIIKTATEVVAGITEGCKISNCALVGGETAEHPGTFPKKSFDLAGFSVGIVDANKIIDGKSVQTGDDLIGISSSGLHSNGYSLIRKLITSKKINLNKKIRNQTLGKILLEPTKIYVKQILNVLKKNKINGMAHITGGGLLENIPRITQNNLCAIIDFHPKDWPQQELFQLIKESANLNQKSMLSTFNCGIGMVIACEPNNTKSIIKLLQKQGEVVNKLGHMEKRKKNGKPIIFSL